MNENTEKQVVQSTTNQVYEKPSIQIYEMENEGDIMDGASGNPQDIPYAPGWSKSGSDIDNGIYNA